MVAQYLPPLQRVLKTISWIHFLLYVLLICDDTLIMKAIAQTTYVNTTISYDSIGDTPTRSALLNIEFIKLFTWHVSLKYDITLKRNLTVTDSFHGKNVLVDLERIVTDETCVTQLCGMCKGLKYIQAKSGERFGLILSQTITTPCPLCIGLGIITMDGCNPFKISQDHINVQFPRGSRPGHEVIYKSLGNAYYHDNRFLMGDLKVIIEAIENDNFIVNSDHVSLTLTLTPNEAVNGFIFEIPYISDEILRIERAEKVTIPGSSIRLKGLGLPLLSAVNITIDKLLPEHRDDLVIHFELQDENIDRANNENNEITGNNGNGNSGFNGIEKSPTGDEPFELTSQDQLEDYMERSERNSKRREDQVLRNMLMFLKRQNTESLSS